MEKERVVLVGIHTPKSTMDLAESMEELYALAEASGAEIVGQVTQVRDARHTSTYIGKGKLEEIKTILDYEEGHTVIINDELSGSQTRNLEAILECKVVDRTMLILDLFAQRAQSSEGKLQVELAQLKYRLPRLVGFYGALSRTGGGIGTRGPGEQQLDTDRRHILRHIHQLEKELDKVIIQRETNRKKREKSQIPVVALVGYTNAGKSSIMNASLRFGGEPKEVYVEDMLFATLDTSFRRITLNNGQAMILTDTVGFVSRLPHDLVAAFRSTLEEVRYADCILHVVDASNGNHQTQSDVTHEILKSYDINDKKIITVFNKMDLVDDNYHVNYQNNSNRLYISAYNEDDIDMLFDVVEDVVMESYRKIVFEIPYDKMSDFNKIAEQYELENIEHHEATITFRANVSAQDAKRYQDYVKKA